MHLKTSVAIPGLKGAFDHFAADTKGNRLFLAAEDHKSVEVFELKSGKHLRSIIGFDTPHSILFVSDNNSLLVTDSGPDEGKQGFVRVVSGDTYGITKSIPVLAAADSSGYDPETKLMYVDTGGLEAKMDTTVISVIDSAKAEVVHELKVDSGRAEAITFEQNGPRMFVNLRTRGQVGVYDKHTYKMLDRWEIPGAKENVPMVLDEANHRLLIVCRTPATLIVFDTETGKVVASLPTVGQADDMTYNSVTRQIYISGGDGFLQVVAQNGPDDYKEVAKLKTGSQAKISIFVPELNQLYVAASANGAVPAKVLIYDVQRGSTASASTDH
jgi:DNA-binding beta-propeller fold protein YncE